MAATADDPDAPLSQAHGRDRVLTALLFAILAAFAAVDTAWAAQQRVLVLSSTTRQSPLAAVAEVELPRLLGQRLGADLVFLSEHIDQARFPDPEYLAAFGEFLRLKYKRQRLDLVIAIQTQAIDFVNRRRDDLFPGAPVVALALIPFDSRLANSTGIVVKLDLATTLNLALALQPATRHVFVVSGADAPGRAYEQDARVSLEPFEGQLTIAYLSGLVTMDLETRLATLPEHSIVYYLVAYQDGAGVAVTPTGYLERIAAVANAPVYSWSSAVMDHGALGGSFLDEGAMMQAVAGLGLRVLGGEAADTIPIESPNLHVRQVDWRQLRRWGISESRVPVGTIVRFREFSAWDRYGGYVIGAAVLVLAQTLLITGLLVQRNRRRRAEEHARHSEAGLRRSYDRIRDLGSRLLTAQEEERSRIARELHDDISHQIALLTIDLELMRAGPQPGDEHATSAITRASGLARSVHELSHQLHPSKLGLIGLVASLQSLQRELTHAGFAVTFTHANVPSNLPPDLTLCLYRVVQEALQNAVKYSQARNVTVNLSGTPDALTLTIADDGVGFDVDAAWGKGLGLISMSERLEAIGGSLKIRSAPAEGTRLEARVPLMLRTPQDTSTS